MSIILCFLVDNHYHHDLCLFLSTRCKFVSLFFLVDLLFLVITTSRAFFVPSVHVNEDRSIYTLSSWTDLLFMTGRFTTIDERIFSSPMNSFFLFVWHWQCKLKQRESHLREIDSLELYKKKTSAWRRTNDDLFGWYLTMSYCEIDTFDVCVFRSAHTRMLYWRTSFNKNRIRHISSLHYRCSCIRTGEREREGGGGNEK